MKFTSLALFLVAAFSVTTFADNLESIPDGEAQAIQDTSDMIRAGVEADAAQNGKAVRDAHAKAHGCVRANFHVNESLPSGLQSSVFVPGKDYSAWIRYSNGSGKSQNDSVGDGRGMAIKLMGVGGAQHLLPDEKATQDFLMINHPVFFVRNSMDYVEFQKIVTRDGDPLKFFIGLNPFKWHLHELSIARAIQKTIVNNPLEVQYWSMTPYLFNDQAMKYTAAPCFQGGNATVDRSNPNFLRQAMKDKLGNSSACFEFFVQLQKDPTSMPVKDPTIQWDETQSVPQKVATIDIPQQAFDSDAQMNFCENLTLSPWHAVPEHRPLGGINRARKVIYETISKTRHDLNKVQPTEPTGTERF